LTDQLGEIVPIVWQLRKVVPARELRKIVSATLLGKVAALSIPSRPIPEANDALPKARHADHLVWNVPLTLVEPEAIGLKLFHQIVDRAPITNPMRSL
jgi:hypothetical protein